MVLRRFSSSSCPVCVAETVRYVLALALLQSRASTFRCRLCGAEHYLSVAQLTGAFVFCYQPYTLRYPLDHYDDGIEPPFVVMRSKFPAEHGLSDANTGPVIVYPRKKQFSRAEVETIWSATEGHCHICDRLWQLAERSRDGWHIDHIIPNIGGGIDTESMENFRVACAKCNLTKGRGYTEATIRLALGSSWSSLNRLPFSIVRALARINDGVDAFGPC